MIREYLYLSALNTEYFGRRYFFEDTLSSTNDFLLENKTIVGDLAVADFQEAGRGRSGRSWFSYEGGLAFSLVLPCIAPSALMPLNIIVGYSVANALKKYAPVKLKWPNDCVIEGHKVCGTLIDARFKGSNLEKVVLGIGINIFETNFSNNKAIKGDYLSKWYKGELSREQIMAETVNELEKSMKLFFADKINIVSLWPLYSANINSDISVHINDKVIKLREVGIDKDGSLIASDGDKTITVTSGEIGYDFGN